MELQQIKYFLVLAEDLHFGNSAEKLFLTQSALSRQIKALEDELGVQLFERSKRMVKLTNAGAFLQKQWLRMMEEIERVQRQAKSIHEGTYGMMSIAYPGSIAYGFLPAFIESIARALPEVKLELVEPTDISIEKMLLNHQLDLALRRDPAENPALESATLYSEHFALIVPGKHPLNQQNFKSLKDARDEKFILSGLKHKTYYVAILRQLFREHNFEPNVHIESDFGAMVMGLVARGLGVSIMPSAYASSAPPGVRFINLPQKTNLYASWRRDDNSPVLRNVLAILHTVAKDFDHQ